MLDAYRFRLLQDLLNKDNIRNEQVLIWANYRKEFETIQSMLGDKCRCVYGGTTLAEKNEAISQERFSILLRIQPLLIRA